MKLNYFWLAAAMVSAILVPVFYLTHNDIPYLFAILGTMLFALLSAEDYLDG